MTQRRAVVPYREVPANRQYPEVRTGDHWTSLSKGNGKLTKDDVELMARAIATELGEDFDNFSDDETTGFTKNHCRKLAIVAANAVGIEVEDD